MRSKSLLFALPLLALAAPVAAQDMVFVSGTGEQSPASAFGDEPVGDSKTAMADIAEKITDPAVQDSVATTIEHITATMLRLPVGQFAQAIENARPGTVDTRIHSDATVADLAGRDAEYLPEKLGDGSRQMMGLMSGFARAIAIMMPEFEKMGREMEGSLRKAKAEATKY